MAEQINVDEVQTEATETTTQTEQTQATETTTDAPAQTGGTDWKAEARKWEKRSTQNLKATEEAEKRLAELTAQLESATKRVADLEAEASRADLVAQAARAHSVDAELLAAMSGETAETITANAQMLAAKFAAVQKHPAITDNGAMGTVSVTRESIQQITDPVARIKARAEHLDLYS